MTNELGAGFCGKCGETFPTTAVLDAHQLETNHEMEQKDHPLRRPSIVITRAKLYPVVARPGPAWQWTYNYTVDSGPVCQYGTGLASLRRRLREKYGKTARVIETWKPKKP